MSDKAIVKADKRLKNAVKSMGLAGLSGVIDYAKNAMRINDIATDFKDLYQDDDVSISDKAKCGSVALSASKVIKDSYHELMGLDMKAPPEDDNYDQYSEEELTNMLEQWEDSQPIDIQPTEV